MIRNAHAEDNYISHYCVKISQTNAHSFCHRNTILNWNFTSLLYILNAYGCCLAVSSDYGS